jgi:hypothetical protein
MSKTYTKGNIIVEEIQIGDIHYEFSYGLHTKAKVLTKPVRDDNGFWTWKSENILTNEIIKYGVNEKYSHYGPNLYNYEAYIGTKQI